MKGLLMEKSLYSDAHKRLRYILRAERRKAGLTQLDVAERLGTYRSFVTKYEIGERRLDVLEYLAVARAIGFDPAMVFDALEVTETD